MALIGARSRMHRGAWQRVPIAIAGLLLLASFMTTAGAAAQTLEWVRNPATGHWYGVLLDMTWADGEAYAMQLGGHLATINDEDEGRWISETFPEEMLIGLNDLAEEGHWVWASGEPVTYTNWGPGEPNDSDDEGRSEDVVSVNQDYGDRPAWTDVYVDVVTRVLIEVVSPGVPLVVPPTAQSLNWQSNPETGHWYAVVEDMLWAEGEAFAIQLGGHLATINDAAEDAWISATFPYDLLIGFNDLAKEGEWVWASGEPVTYTNWVLDEPPFVEPPRPNGDPTEEDYAEINFIGSTGAAGWNDTWAADVPQLVEVVSPVAPPAELPVATPTPQPPSPTPSPSPTASMSPTPSASPQASPGGGGIGPGGSSSGGGYRTPGTLVPGITTNIPTPGDVSREPAVLTTNLLLAGIVMVAFTIATELLNRSLGDLEPALNHRFPIIRRVRRALGRLDVATVTRLAGRPRRLVDAARLAAIAAFYGLAFAFLDPTWNPLTVSGVWLVVAMAVAVGVVGLGGDIAAWAVGRRWGVVGDLEIRPGSLLAAIGSTIVTRTVALVPGVMIGSPEAIDIDPNRIDRRRLGRLAAVGMGTVLVIGLAAWALTLATSALRGSSSGLGAALGGAEAFLLLVFAFAVQNGFVQLLAVRQSAGLALRRTHPLVWGAALFAVTFAFWHTLVNPNGDLAAALRTTNALAFLLTAGVVLVLSVAVWIWTRLDRPIHLVSEDELDEGAVISAIDLQRAFKLGPKALAQSLGIDTARAKALRWHLGIEEDPACRHDFVFGKMAVAMYSEVALERMREAIAGGINVDDVRRAYEASHMVARGAGSGP